MWGDVYNVQSAHEINYRRRNSCVTPVTIGIIVPLLRGRITAVTSSILDTDEKRMSLLPLTLDNSYVFGEQKMTEEGRVSRQENATDFLARFARLDRTNE